MWAALRAFSTRPRETVTKGHEKTAWAAVELRRPMRVKKKGESAFNRAG